MIKPGYKRLGDYIEPMDERNSNLSVKLSQGICNNKYFITPRQVAENSANDKIVRTGQFAYNRATTRNGDKISIAYREGPDCTVSSAYQIFRIKDENKLNPHYLWMWFRRPEFDRYARFKSRGSAHEFFEWDEMCEVYLPIPDIDEQRRIVSHLQAIETRITSNLAYMRELEQLAKTIFDRYFGFAYFSGATDELEELELRECVSINECNLSSKELPDQLLYLETGGVTNNQFNEFSLIDLRTEELPSRAKRIVKSGDIVYSSVRPNLRHYGILRNIKPGTVASTGFIVLNSNKAHISNELIYMWITFDKYTEYLNGIAAASKATYPSIIPEDLLGLKVWVPKATSKKHRKAQESLQLLYKYIGTIDEENQLLSQFTSILLPKLMI